VDDLIVFERNYNLVNDKELDNASVVMAAQVTFRANNPVTRKTEVNNSILLKGKDNIAIINCVHTAIKNIHHQSSKEEIENIAYNRQIETSKIEIFPEDHFISLCSFVESIAEFGIFKLMRESFKSESENPLEISIGFNDQMQYQFIRALSKVAPEITNELMIEFIQEMFETAPANWLQEKFRILNDTYNVKRIVRKFKYSELILNFVDKLDRDRKITFLIDYTGSKISRIVLDKITYAFDRNISVKILEKILDKQLKFPVRIMMEKEYSELTVIENEIPLKAYNRIYNPNLIPSMEIEEVINIDLLTTRNVKKEEKKRKRIKPRYIIPLILITQAIFLIIYYFAK
jgi:hypothetical protein